MNSIRDIIKKYNMVVWIRIWGKFIVSFNYYMIRPFLAIYLFEKLEVNAVASVLVCTLMPIGQLFVNLISGKLGDKLGRKSMMVVGQMLQACAIFGCYFSNSVLVLGGLCFVQGMGNALFGPASQAHIMDIVEEQHRIEVFALMQTFFNIGTVLGPLAGVLFYYVNMKYSFLVGGSILILYSVILMLFIKENKREEIVKEKLANGEEKHISMFCHPEFKELLVITILSIPMVLLYSQIDTVLALHLGSRFKNPETIISTLVIYNGVLVSVLQMFVVNLSKKYKRGILIVSSFASYAVVALGYAFSPIMFFLIVTETISVLAEIVVGPILNTKISEIAPKGYEARFFAVYQLDWTLGGIIGPIISVMVFNAFGGVASFVMLSAILIMATIGWILYFKRVR